jgi:hypothetical protein
MRHHRLPTALLLVLLASLLGTACSDSTGPSKPRYPAVQGTYDFSAPISEIPGARWSGNLTLLVADPDRADFSGTYVMTLYDPQGRSAGSFTGSITQGSVTTGGAISFGFDDALQVRGTVDGAQMSGTWIMSDGQNNYTGSFTAVRR